MDKAIVIGASGGIGAAMVSAMVVRGAAVVGLSRASAPRIDYDRDATIPAAAAACADRGPFDTLIVATGLLHGDGVRPEKSVREIEGAALDRLFRVNVIGPALVLRHFIPLMARDRPARIALLSARVGSIGDNRIGGWVGYRSAKAALNQVVRTVAIELARTHPHAVLVGLHPGTVATALSAPFRRSVRDGDLLGPNASAEHLLDVLAALTPVDSGGCFDWRGARIEP